MSAYELRISDWSSDVCSSDLVIVPFGADGDLYVTGNKPSEAYLRSITFNIVGLAGTYSAYSADRQFQELLRIAHPSAYTGLRDSLNRLRDELGNNPTLSIATYIRGDQQIGSAACRERVCQYG